MAGPQGGPENPCKRGDAWEPDVAFSQETTADIKRFATITAPGVEGGPGDQSTATKITNEGWRAMIRRWLR